jgi:two-component system, NarL family, invasion response regulator UvrY
VRQITRALVIDDHPVVLQGCRRVLEDAGITVLEARDISTGYRLYLRHKPDVVIIDLAMHDGGLGGLSLVSRISANNPRSGIIVFSMHRDPAIVARALQAGAKGYVVKDTSSEELTKAIETVQTGNAYLSHELAVQVVMAQTPARQSPLAQLTPRELQTLSLLAEGKPYDRIARELKVSYRTVVNLSYHLKQKLGARTMPELIRTAVRLLPQS